MSMDYDFLDDGEDVAQAATPSLDDLKQADYGNLGLDVDESSVSNDDLLFADDNNDSGSLDANVLAGNVENKPKVDSSNSDLDLEFDSLDDNSTVAKPENKPSISKPKTVENNVKPASNSLPDANSTEYSDADYDEFNSLDDINDTTTQPEPEPSVESRAKHKKPTSTSKKSTTTRKSSVTTTTGGQENGSVDLKLVRKVATILEVLNGLTANDKKIVKSFLSTISQINMAEKVDNTDASMVVSILSLDSTVKSGVLTLMKAKSLAGASRAFYLMGLNPEQFNNMALILQLVQALSKPLTVDDTMDSIRKAAQTVDECLNLRFTGKSVEFLTPVKTVLEKVEKVTK